MRVGEKEEGKGGERGWGGGERKVIKIAANPLL